MAISQYSQPLQSLNQPGITPLPFEEMLKAGQYVQKRYDDSVNATEDQFTQLANSNIIDAQKAALETIKGTFSKEMSNLMDKYKGQTYSSDFQRESKRLISQMASDPTVKLLKENKAQYDYDDAVARELKSKGIEYYDPRLNGQTLMNPDGTPAVYKAGVRAFKHDEMIDEQGAKILQAMTQNGAITDNGAQLNKAIAAATKPSSTIFKDKVTSLKQLGYTDKDAAKVATEYITQRFNSFRKRDIDSQYIANQMRAQEEYMKNLPKAPESVITTRGVGKIEANPANTQKIAQINNVLNNTSSNPVSTYASVAGGSLGYAPSKNNSEKIQLVNEADKYFGNYKTKFKTPEDKLKAYARALSAHDAETSEVLKAPENNDYNTEFKNYILTSNFKTTDLSGVPLGFDSGEVDRSTEGIKNSKFLGVATVKPSAENPTGVAFRFADEAGKEFSVIQDPKDLAPQLQLVGKLGMLKTASSQVIDPQTNMLATNTWIKDYDLTTGEPVTYIPVRSFTSDGVPATKLVKVKGDPDLLDATKEVRRIKALPPEQRGGQLFSADDLKDYAINDYFVNGTNVAPGLKTIELANKSGK